MDAAPGVEGVGAATRVPLAQARPRPALIRLGLLECAMLGAAARSFSQWGNVVLRAVGRPSLYAPPRPRGLMADHSTCEVLLLLAWWLGFVPVVQTSNFQRIDTAVDTALLAGVGFWWTAAKRRRGGQRSMELALAEMAYAVAESGPSGLAAAACDMRTEAGVLADWVARWLEHGQHRDRLMQIRRRPLLWRQRHVELIERAAAAARIFERRDSALRQRAATPREVRAWRAALVDVVSWTRVCGLPAASAVSTVLCMAPHETLRCLQIRLQEATARERAQGRTRLESTSQESVAWPM